MAKIELTEIIDPHTNCEEYKTIQAFLGIGFDLLLAEWRDVWGQGDGHWVHFVMVRQDIKIESTVQGYFTITINSGGGGG